MPSLAQARSDGGTAAALGHVNPSEPTVFDEWNIPGKPVAHNSGLLWIYYGLLWCIVAYYFRLLGVPGRGF